VHDTRQAVIDAAVSLFSEVGYTNTEIVDILRRAGVTKGAFFSHFPTKEAVVAAIIAEAEVKANDVMLGAMASPASALENLILATLLLTDMTKRDPLTRVADVLGQTLGPVNHRKPDVLSNPSWSLTETALKTAITEGELLDDIDVDAVTLTIRAALAGNRLLSGATTEDAFGQMARIWQVILRGNVPPEKLRHLELFATHMAEQYSTT